MGESGRFGDFQQVYNLRSWYALKRENWQDITPSMHTIFP